MFSFRRSKAKKNQGRRPSGGRWRRISATLKSAASGNIFGTSPSIPRLPKQRRWASTGWSSCQRRSRRCPTNCNDDDDEDGVWRAYCVLCLYVVDLKVGIHSVHEFGLEESRHLGGKTLISCKHEISVSHFTIDTNGTYSSTSAVQEG